MNKLPIYQLETAMNRRIQALPGKLRPFTARARDLPRAILLTGQRGVGKTTFLLHHALNKRFLFISADNPLVAGFPLYDAVHYVFMQGYEGVIIDEVHYASDWSIHIKALYDDFPDRYIWVSDSSSMVLRSGAGDLSRRFVPIVMPLLSFREFAELKTDKQYPTFNPFESIGSTGTAEVLDLFREYKQYGTRPFFTEGNFQERMLGILDKSLHSDVPYFVPHITEGNMRLMNAVIGTLARASIPRLHVRSLCADWNVGAEKLYQLLFVMESVGIVRIIRKVHETKANTVGAKLFFGDPVYYHIFDGETGTAREAFIAAMFGEAGFSVEAERDETKGDFCIGGATRVEVGGPSKQKKHSDFVFRDDIDIPAGNVLPLWSAGFLY